MSETSLQTGTQVDPSVAHEERAGDAPANPGHGDAFRRYIRLSLGGMCEAAESQVRGESVLNPSRTPSELEQFATSSLRSQARSFVDGVDDIAQCREALFCVMCAWLTNFVPTIVARATSNEIVCPPASQRN